MPFARGRASTTVRGDLICILGQLLKRRDRFDYVMIETTGLADPGPVAQTFFLDDDLKDQFLLDAIVTVIDARHIEKHLEEMDEPGQQVAFADVVLFNKMDLVPAQDLARIERRIRSINGTTRLFRTRNADVPIANVLDVGAFDLNRALAVDGAFLEPEYPFEWGRDWRLSLWAPGKAAQAVDAHLADAEISALCWSPDGRLLAVASSQGRLSVYELITKSAIAAR